MSSVYVIESPDSAKGDWLFDTPSHPDPRYAHAGTTKSDYEIASAVGISRPESA